MTYEERKRGALESHTASNKFKAALIAFDDMDCLKALDYAEALKELMQLRFDEVTSKH